MKLSELIKTYRAENNLSQREFAARAHLTNGYLWILENEVNPKTGRPATPSLTSLLGIAKAMNITLDDLLEKVEDFDVSLKVPKIVEHISEEEKALLEAFRAASTETKEIIFKIISR